MATVDLKQIADNYRCNGYISGIPIISDTTAKKHRDELERAEAQHGKIHYLAKVHTLFRSPYQLATNAFALDIVEQLIGPDILLFNVTYIIKEAGAASHVSWHQDLTYWGLSHDDQVSMWLALSPATEQTGCMKMIAGSHTQGPIKHSTTEDKNNVLLQGQTVTQVDNNRSTLCPLQPGEASFHHGWTLHASTPNLGTDRRIGVNVQYIAPHVRQTKHDMDTALLVRGKDKYKHFASDTPAVTDFDPEAVKQHKVLQKLYEETAGTS